MRVAPIQCTISPTPFLALRWLRGPRTGPQSYFAVATTRSFPEVESVASSIPTSDQPTNLNVTITLLGLLYTLATSRLPS